MLMGLRWPPRYAGARSSPFVPPRREFFEIDAAIPIGIDLIEPDLQFLGRDVFVHGSHEANELPERQPAVPVDVVEIEIFAQAAPLLGARADVVQSRSVTVT